MKINNGSTRTDGLNSKNEQMIMNKPVSTLEYFMTHYSFLFLPSSLQLAQVFVFQPPSEMRLINRLKIISSLEGLHVTGKIRHL